MVTPRTLVFAEVPGVGAGGPPSPLVPLTHAAPAASSIPGGGGTHHGPAQRFAFPITSVGSAAKYFQFLLCAGSAGSIFAFITGRLLHPPLLCTCVLP